MVNLFIMREMVNAFTLRNKADIFDAVVTNIPYFAILAAATMVVTFIQMACLTISAKRQSRRIRLLLFQVK